MAYFCKHGHRWLKKRDAEKCCNGWKAIEILVMAGNDSRGTWGLYSLELVPDGLNETDVRRIQAFGDLALSGSSNSMPWLDEEQ